MRFSFLKEKSFSLGTSYKTKDVFIRSSYYYCEKPKWDEDSHSLHMKVLDFAPFVFRTWANSSHHTTGSPSSKYKHRRTSALLSNIQNIRICMGKKTYRFCDLRKWKDFNKKKITLPKLCVTSLLCGPRAVLWPFYGFLCTFQVK